MKYNKSEIMKAAWQMFLKSQKWLAEYRISFAEALRRAWAAAKAAVKAEQDLTHEIGKSVDGWIVWMRPAPIAMSGRMGWVLTGRTFAAKRAIKSLGFQWDVEAKKWFTESREIAIRFASL